MRLAIGVIRVLLVSVAADARPARVPPPPDQILDIQARQQPPVAAANWDGDAYPNTWDCNDDNPAVFPGAPEIANGINDDCDGVIDAGFDTSADWPAVKSAQALGTPDRHRQREVKGPVPAGGLSLEKLPLIDDRPSGRPARASRARRGNNRSGRDRLPSSLGRRRSSGGPRIFDPRVLRRRLEPAADGGHPRAVGIFLDEDADRVGLVGVIVPFTQKELAAGELLAGILAQADDLVPDLAEKSWDFGLLLPALAWRRLDRHGGKEKAEERQGRSGPVVKRDQEMEAIRQVGGALASSTFDMKEVLNYTMDMIREVMNVEAGSLLFLEGQELEVAVAFNGVLPVPKKFRLKLGQGIAGCVAARGEAVIANDHAASLQFFPVIDEESGFRTRSALCVPMISQGRVIGVIEVRNKLNGRFDFIDRDLLQAIAASVCIALENARLYKETVAAAEHERDVQRPSHRAIPHGPGGHLSL